MIYLLQNGLSVFQIGVVYTCGTIVENIAEVPFGIFADKKSYKISVYSGYISKIVALILFILTPTFLGFIVANVVNSIGEAGISGADTATMVGRIQPKDENNFFIISRKITTYFGMVMILISGFMYMLSEQSVFIMVIVANILCMVIYNIIYKLPIVAIEDDESHEDSKQNYGPLTFIMKNIFFVSIIFFPYLILPATSIYFPTMITENNMPDFTFSICLFFSSIISIVALSVYVEKRTISEQLLSLISLSIMTIAIGAFNNMNLFYMSILIFVCMNGVSVIFYTNLAIHTKDLVKRNFLATALSIKGAIINTAFLVSDIIIATMIFKFGSSATYILMGIALLIMAILLFIYNKKTLRSKAV